MYYCTIVVLYSIYYCLAAQTQTSIRLWMSRSCPPTISTAIYVSFSQYILRRYVSSYYCICVLTLLYMCRHTCRHTAMYVSSYCYICVLILSRMCPHTAVYVSSCCHICVLILLYMCPRTLRGALLALTYTSSVLILTYVSSYCYICVPEL